MVSGDNTLPFVLQIDALDLLHLGAVLDDGERRVEVCMTPVGLAESGTMFTTCEVVSLVALVVLEIKPGAHRMRIA